MQSSLFIAATGLKTHTAGMQNLSNNIANVSTVAYKQQSISFDDLMYQNSPTLSSAWPQVYNQTGMGVQVGSIRTLFSEGAFEITNTVTDLALEGKGFFQVTTDDKTHYTRAGNFSFNKDGFLVDPSGYALTGIRYVDGVEQGGLTPIQVDWGDAAIIQSEAKATSAVSAYFNLAFTDDYLATDPANPAFNLLQAWDGTQDPPLSSYGYNQQMRVYDAEGTAHNLTIYFDVAGFDAAGQRIYEYIVTMPPELDGSAAAGTEGAGLLMSGTLTFTSAGELVDMSAFTPGGGDYKDLNNWMPSALAEGYPQLTMQTNGGQTITFSLDMGIKADADAWASAPASAAAVGTDYASLPSMGSVTRDMQATTAYGGSSSVGYYNQNGYAVGSLSALDITEEGSIIAHYSNGQSETLYRIPVFRFTSEDGLYREGGNHFSYTDACGNVEYGVAGSENYSKIIASTLETSNVDMTVEMTNMIIMQRGFQMNSKSVTTSDAMLQKALELKR